jgi:hypothetical protein
MNDRSDVCIGAARDHDDRQPLRFSRNEARLGRNCNAVRADQHVGMAKLNSGKRLQVQSAAGIAVLEALTDATLTVAS